MPKVLAATLISPVLGFVKTNPAGEAVKLPPGVATVGVWFGEEEQMVLVG